ncbi:hypothetical protein [Anaeromyxobacter oryzae]|nr:hypothetical protein [Anaeromyxobacter oryzae]
MTKRIVTLVLSGVLGLIPIATHAQYDEEWTDEGAGAAPAAPDSSAPGTQAPTDLPPAPPTATPEAYGQPQAPAAVPPGQWVYTQQYGWIWMPYSDAYAYVPPGGYGSPYAYVYYPADACWTWISAPWIWGIGPWPFFGTIGPVRFAWYGHGWWRYPSRWHYAPAYHGGYYAGRPVPGYRGGYAARPAPYGGGSYGGRAFPASRGGYAGRPAPYGGGFRGAGPAPSARAFVGGGHGGGGFASPRGSAGRGGSWSAAPRSGGSGGGGGGRGGGFGGHGGRGHR